MSSPSVAGLLPVSALAVLALPLAACVEPSPSPYPYAAAPPPQSTDMSPPPSADMSPPPMPECRDVHLSVMIGNQPQDVIGTACRQPDGTWRIRS